MRRFIGPLLIVLAATVLLLGSFTKGAWADAPIILYGFKGNEITWYRYDRTPGTWQGPRLLTQEQSWKDYYSQYRNAFSVGTSWLGQTFVGISFQDGSPVFTAWQHPGYETGAPMTSYVQTLTASPETIAAFSQYYPLYMAGEGVFYQILQNGNLNWYRIRDFASSSLQEIQGNTTVGWGWNTFRGVFFMGKGQIYAVRTDGTLLLYTHLDYLTGGPRWAGPRVVGSGWQNFKLIIPIGGGVMLAVAYDGRLLWYKHYGRVADARGAYHEVWDGPVTIGYGWQYFDKIMPVKP